VNTDPGVASPPRPTRRPLPATSGRGSRSSRSCAGRNWPSSRRCRRCSSPSGNNIASLLARWDAGSQAAFVAKMNVAVGPLGLRSTRCADVSGADPATASTAAGPCPGRAR